eukprot:3605949-Rhodomonas_salina.2
MTRTARSHARPALRALRGRRLALEPDSPQPELCTHLAASGAPDPGVSPAWSVRVRVARVGDRYLEPIAVGLREGVAGPEAPALDREAARRRVGPLFVVDGQEPHEEVDEVVPREH